MVVFFNVLLLAIAVFSTLVVYRYRSTLKSVSATSGAALILIGVWIRTAYSLADLTTVVYPDLFRDASGQTPFIEALHSTIEWPTNALFVLLVVIGLSLMVNHNEKRGVGAPRKPAAGETESGGRDRPPWLLSLQPTD